MLKNKIYDFAEEMRKKDYIRNLSLKEKKKVLDNSKFQYEVFKNKDGIMKVIFVDSLRDKKTPLMDIHVMGACTSSHVAECVKLEKSD